MEYYQSEKLNVSDDVDDVKADKTNIKFSEIELLNKEIKAACFRLQAHHASLQGLIHHLFWRRNYVFVGEMGLN